MPRFNKPCPKCGALYKGTRCEKCGGHKATGVGVRTPEQEAQLQTKKQFLYGGDYRKRAKYIRENSTHCHICRKPFQGGDPIEADHLFPELGSASPLAPAHRTCNQRRGNRPLTP